MEGTREMNDWQKGFWMGVGSIVAGILFGVVFLPRPVCAQTLNWDSSQLNYTNSPYNYDNSSNKWENSSQNWNNSQYNYNASNGVYTNSGDRIGYETISSEGTKNYFDNNGSRQGYTPYGR
jgi:hypothetical protein